MAGIFSDVCGLNDFVNNFYSGMNNTVSQVQEVGFEVLSRLNEIIANNGEELINRTKQAMLEGLTQVEDKTKQDVLDVIEQFTYNFSNSAESVIQYAKNATMDVLDESLQKIRHETHVFVEDIVTDQIFMIVSIFILITLFSATLCLVRRLSDDHRCGSQLFEVLSNMLLIITSLLTFIWFGLALVWFFERAVEDKGPFYIIGAIILFFAVVYGICHLWWILKTKIPVGSEWLRKEISQGRIVGKRRQEDSMLPTLS